MFQRQGARAGFGGPACSWTVSYIPTAEEVVLRDKIGLEDIKKLLVLSQTSVTSRASGYYFISLSSSPWQLKLFLSLVLKISELSSPRREAWELAVTFKLYPYSGWKWPLKICALHMFCTKPIGSAVFPHLEVLYLLLKLIMFTFMKDVQDGCFITSGLNTCQPDLEI